jgi:hypothetical protein
MEVKILKRAQDRINSLEKYFQSSEFDYYDISQSCESAVVEWRWNTIARNHLKLLENERGRGRSSNSRWLKARPKKINNQCEHGFDSNGKIIALREVGTQTFIQNIDGVSMAFRFATMSKREIVMIYRQEVERGFPVNCTWYSAHQRGFETYTSTHDLVTSIDCTWSNQPHKADDYLSAQYEVIYNLDGQLQQVKYEYRKAGRHPGGKPGICFRS